MILGISLVTLLGLQTSATNQAIRTRNKQQAMLIARRIMSAIENQGSSVPNINKLAPAEEILKLFVAVDPVDATNQTKNKFQTPLDAEIKIDFISIKGLPDNSVKKVTLRVFWSANPADSIEVVYCIPTVPEAPQ